MWHCDVQWYLVPSFIFSQRYVVLTLKIGCAGEQRQFEMRADFWALHTNPFWPFLDLSCLDQGKDKLPSGIRFIINFTSKHQDTIWVLNDATVSTRWTVCKKWQMVPPGNDSAMQCNVLKCALVINSRRNHSSYSYNRSPIFSKIFKTIMLMTINVCMDSRYRERNVV